MLHSGLIHETKMNLSRLVELAAKGEPFIIARAAVRDILTRTRAKGIEVSDLVTELLRRDVAIKETARWPVSRDS